MNRKLVRALIAIMCVGVFAIVIDKVDKNSDEILQNSQYVLTIRAEEKAAMREEYVMLFLSNCSVGNVDKAYEMLDDKSKEEFKTKEEFAKFATQKLYNNEIAKKTYTLKVFNEKEAITRDYTNVEYLVSFTVVEKDKYNEYMLDKNEYNKYLTHQITLVDYSPNNYKISISAEKKYE